MALDQFIPGSPDSPANSPLQAANPIARNPTLQKAMELRVSAGPVDPLNLLHTGMADAQSRMLELQKQLPAAQAAMDGGRDAYLKHLEYGYSPERESALNWQAIGNMGAAMMQPSSEGNTQWSRGAAAYQNQRNLNQQALDKAGTELATGKYALSKDDYSQIMDQYKLAQTDYKDSQKGMIEWQKEHRKNNPAKMVTDQTGAVYEYDPITNQRTLVINSNGLTAQDGTALGDYYKALVESYGSDNQGIIQRKYQEEVKRRQSFNRQQMGLTELANEQPATPYDVVAAPGTEGEVAAIAKADWERTHPQGGAPNFGIFDQSEIINPSVAPPVGQGKLEQEQWKSNQIRYTEEAMKDEAAARANLAQTQAMYESSKGAMAVGAKTGALQPFLNGFGLVMESLGLQGGLTTEAIKGQSFQAIANQAVQVMQNAAKGTQTEGDAKRFAASLVQVKNPAEANALILKFMEAQLWKREQELTFRSMYANVNPSSAGASSKWSEWSRNTPVILQINDKPVFANEYIKNYMAANPEAVQLHGEDYVKREAIKAWRKRSN